MRLYIYIYMYVFSLCCISPQLISYNIMFLNTHVYICTYLYIQLVPYISSNMFLHFLCKPPMLPTPGMAPMAPGGAPSAAAPAAPGGKVKIVTRQWFFLGGVHGSLKTTVPGGV